MDGDMASSVAVYICNHGLTGQAKHPTKPDESCQMASLNVSCRRLSQFVKWRDETESAWSGSVGGCVCVCVSVRTHVMGGRNLRQCALRPAK